MKGPLVKGEDPEDARGVTAERMGPASRPTLANLFLAAGGHGDEVFDIDHLASDLISVLFDKAKIGPAILHRIQNM